MGIVENKKNNLLLFGPPGAGKSSFCAQLDPAQFYPIQVGKEIRRSPFLQKYDLLPDEIVCDFVFKHILKAQNRSFIIDGFPSSQEHLRKLVGFLKSENLFDETKALYFNVPESVCMKRCLNRVMCPSCDQTFSGIAICPFCQETLIPRKDDTLKNLIRRQKRFKKQIFPVFETARHIFLTLTLEDVHGDLEITD